MSGPMAGFGWIAGDVLLAFLWQGLCIQAAAACLLWWMRPAGARARYAVLCAALVLCVVVPVLDAAARLDTWQASAVLPDGAAGIVTLPATWSGVLAGMPAMAAPALPWRAWLAMAWLAGVSGMTLRLLLGMAWLRQVIRSSRPWTDAAWTARVQALSGRLRLPRGVALRIAPGLSSPVTAGWWRPVVLVPAGLVSGMPADLLEALLAHELAHVRRLDYLVNFLQRVIEALLFFHPSVWWLSRRLGEEREHIADDMAAACIGAPRTLARALDSLSRGMPVPAAGLDLAQQARGGALAQRIRRLLRPAPAPSRAALAAPWLAAALGLACAAAWTVPAAPTAPSGSGLAGIEALVKASGAAHVLVVDAASGAKLIGRAEHEEVPIASLTKLMTAMVVLDTAPDLARPVRIEREDAEATRNSVSQLPVGASATLGTLLKLALMSSDNRAAHALARSYPGGTPAFERSLRDKMAQLGLKHTTLREPTGLSPANRSTAADIERIVNAAAAYPEIARDSTRPAETVNIASGALHYRNTNPLVGRRGWDIQLSKTGMSPAAGRCLVMRVRVQGRDLTLVLLKARQQPA
ncbi:M56 family metallopeptidase [Cupriavidus malaysiensis]|nr:M56 family metallopeptidase [Cupriavidus malaysiensis]